MTCVAVVAHQGKQLGEGLDALRAELARAGFEAPLWYEVPKSRKAPKQVRRAVEHGADLVFVWGGDGMVQRCAGELAGTGVAMAVLPAGTANLFATNLGIPHDLEAAVAVGLHGHRRALDVGVVNDERFAVMTGAGLDGRMIRDADGVLKDRLGRLAYVLTAVRHAGDPGARARIKVDGERWFDGDVACVLVANVGRLFGGITAFEDAAPDDGVLEVGVVTARTRWQWARVATRLAGGHATDSPFVRTTRGRTVDVRFDHGLPMELDGGARGATDRMRVRVEPGALLVCVPEPGADPEHAAR